MLKHRYISELKENKKYLVPLFIYVFLFLFFCSKTSPLYPSNEWADVNLYFSIGKAVFNGQTLYSETFDPKGPLIFFIYGFSYFISNTTFLGVFIALFFAWSTALTAVFLMVKDILKGEDMLALLAALLTPVFALSYMHFGGSPEEFVLCFQLISLFFFVKYFKEKKSVHNPKYMLVHGVTTSMIFFLKLNLTAFCLFPLLGLFISILIQEDFKSFIRNSIYYLAGLLIITLPIILYFLINGALTEAFNTYIILNKNLAVTVSISEVISNGMSRVYLIFRHNIVEALILTIGVVYFPIKFLKNKVGEISFLIGGIALMTIIFFAGVFHFYYPLPLYVFIPLGLISIFYFLKDFIKIYYSKKLIYFMLAICLICGYSITNFFGLGFAALARKTEQEGANYYFAKIIEKEENPTLLNIAFGDVTNIYTLSNIVPNTRFFSSLNIAYEKYPTLRDEQTKYIENKETLFVIIQQGEEPGYFEQLPALTENYTLVDRYNGREKYQHGSVEKSYLLYKRK